MSTARLLTVSAVVSLFVGVACGGSSGPDDAQGGSSSGGATSGGAPSQGGVVGSTGGSKSTGGVVGSTGGSKSTGGVVGSTGGSKNTGGASASGGASSSGGAAASSCSTAADCRLVDDYCTGCDCRALAKGAPDPVCTGTPVNCLIAPCQNHAAVCRAGRCVVE